MIWGATAKFVVTFAVAYGRLSGAVPSEPEFVSLFDGRTLEGWTPVATDRFTVRDGVIVNDGGTGWLRSDQAYKDFEFRAEFRALRKGSDSGVLFRATPESTSRVPNWPLKCYQLQVIDGPGLFMMFGHGLPCKFDRDAEALRSVLKGPGEWQTLSLKVVGGRVEASLDGVLVTVSDAVTLPEGHIGIQGELGLFEWRALRIREYPAR